jgi:hypothetical protein
VCFNSPFPPKRFKLDQFRQIARRRRRRRIGDGPVVRRTQPAPETIRPLSEHAQQGLFLPPVDPVAEVIEQLRLGEEELNSIQGALLRLERDTGKPVEPFVDLVRGARALKLGVIASASFREW